MSRVVWRISITVVILLAFSARELFSSSEISSEPAELVTDVGTNAVEEQQVNDDDALASADDPANQQLDTNADSDGKTEIPRAAAKKPKNAGGKKTRKATDGEKGGKGEAQEGPAKYRERFATRRDRREKDCYRYLIVAPMSGMSHQHFYDVLATALATKCHDVSLITARPARKKSGLKYNSFSSETYRELSDEVFSISLKDMSRSSIMWDSVKYVWKTMNKAADACEKFLADPLTQQMLTKDVKEYDYIMLSPHFAEECAIVFVHLHRKKFNTPWGFVYPSMPLPWANAAMGNPPLETNFPAQLLGYGDKMDVWQRAINMVYDKYMLWMRWYWSYPRVEAVLRRDFDPDVGTLRELEATSSMYLLNLDEGACFYPYTRTPQTILVGCLHCREPEPLPQDLEEWIEGSGKHGVVLFSLGTLMKAEDMEERDKLEFVQAFSVLEQRVIWKWDGPPIPELSDNVRLMPWVPQQDILAHPKCKAFVTHGGLMGTQEAAYHGVPMLGIPIDAEEYMNMGKADSDGAGIMLHWSNYSANAIISSIRRVMTDPKIKKAAQRRSLLLRDQKESPLERAVWTIEYMARHRGANHLRPASRDLAWYQVHLIDVWFMFLAIAMVALLTMGVLVASFLWCCRRKTRNGHSWNNGSEETPRVGGGWGSRWSFSSNRSRNPYYKED